MRAKEFLPERDPKGVAQGVADYTTDFADKMIKTFGGGTKTSNMQAPTGGDRLRHSLGFGKDKSKTAKAPAKNTKVSAPEPKQSAPAKKLPRPDEVKPGSAYSDSKGTWTFDGTKWSDGKNFIDNPTGYKNFIVALQKGKAIEA